ncbi:serine/arginine repetitive matrix protein 2-like isoform X2 [Conger conger]|uniref:serine/arginine repetitive matrix protein 2-like isoform X2 n=1 Tax=Conger conger TaxID=82655 RepID=UPI002A59B562|nr:serine/arginine repetitive matrix protein 2-like isoform X2 [Conger conger]
MEEGEENMEYGWKRRQSVRMLRGMLKRVGPFRPDQIEGAEESKVLPPALMMNPETFQAPPPGHDIIQATPPKPIIFQTPPPKPEFIQATPPKPDIFQATPPKPDIFQATPPKHDLIQATPPKPDIFQATPPKHDIFQATPPKHDIFQATPPKPDIFQATPPKPDIFQATPPKHDIFQATPPKPDIFQATPPKHDIFQATPPKHDIFPALPPKPDFFQATPPKHDIFQATPPKHDIFQATPPKPDIFQATPPKHDIFQATPPKPDFFQATPPKHDIFQATPPKHDIFPAIPPKPIIFQATPPKHDIFQATPPKPDIFQATPPKHDIFQATPPKHDIFQATPPEPDIFQATPPKHDLIRIPLREWKENGHIKVNGSTSSGLKSTNSKDCASWDDKEYPVYENIFLIGEEKCVEDWPEDSPELHPDWKPAGRLRLRRESMKILMETPVEWGNEDPMENSQENNSKARKSRRFTLPSRRESKIEAELSEKGADLLREVEGEEDESDVADECKKRQKRGKKFKLAFLQRRDSKAAELPETPPGATCRNYHLSEAAEAEWRSAQRDESLRNGEKGEESGGVEEGDTDSLMEWWNTVEQWDELPSDEEDETGAVEEEELKVLSEKVQKGIHVFNKVFMEQAEGLWQHIVALLGIAESLSEFHRKAKIASITGGTTTAVGGVTAIAGLVLTPFTFGASLILTAVGIGVATAGGLTSASATISDSVNNSHDRKKVEKIVEEFQASLADMHKCVRYVQQGLERLLACLLRLDSAGPGRGPGLSRAVQEASEASATSDRALQISSRISAMLAGLFQGMDSFYMDQDPGELRKGCKTELAAKIRGVAERLHEALVELNGIREELQDTAYHI